MVELVRRIDPGGRLRRSWSLEGGISAQMVAFEIETPDGQLRKLILRKPGEAALQQNPHAAQDEFQLLRYLKSQDIAVPAPVYLDAGGEVFHVPCLVIEYVEGEPVFGLPFTGDHAYQFASHLAQIHRLKPEGSDLVFLQGEAAGDLGGRPAGVDPAWDEVHLWEILMAASPFPTVNTPVLLHGDFWPGNILWRSGSLVAVVDWEDAALGDPLIDLAISRLDLLCIFGVDAMHTFTRYYRSMMAVDFISLPYWDLWAALRLARMIGSDLAGWAAFYEPYSRHDITGETIRSCYRWFTAQALKKLASR